MLIKLLLAPIFLIIDLLISILPSGIFSSGVASAAAMSSDGVMVVTTAADSTLSFSAEFITMMGYGIYFFGVGNFLLIMGTVIFWSTTQISWAVIEWIYKKIPGVN